MMSKKAEIPVWGSNDFDVNPDQLGLKGSPTWVDKVFSPPPRSKGKIFEGEVDEVIEGFIKILQKDNLLQ
jgi:electron transfer flavoprotein alpha/beta subunit